MQLDWLNSALSPVVYGDIALSINTQYKVKQSSFICVIKRGRFLCIHQIENKKNSPDFNFQSNFTKFGEIHLYPMKYLPTKFELDRYYSF